MLEGRGLGDTWEVCDCMENGVYFSEDRFPMGQVVAVYLISGARSGG